MRTPSQRPNILFLIADDLGTQTGCYGNRTARTPHIDQLASEGVLFENAYTTCSVCSPARASMFTGLYPHQHGLLGMPWGYEILAGAPRLPKILSDTGYRTGLIGKKHVTSEDSLGFDLEVNIQDPRRVKQHGERVRNFLEEQSDRPFFLAVGFVDPHTPHINREVDGLPEKLLGPDDVEPLEFQGSWNSEKLREDVSGYYNNMSRFDAGVGLVLDELERSGHRENTVVILHSDHGPGFYRSKASSYEPGIHVPLIVRWPGIADIGSRRTELVSNVDIFPTIAEICGCQIPQDIPGRSLFGLFHSGKLAWRKYLCCEYHGNQTADYFPMRSIRDDRHKLILNLLDRPNPVIPYLKKPYKDLLPFREPESVTGDTLKAFETFANPPRKELYDLTQDPVEHHNLAGHKELSETEERLEKELQTWREETCDPYLDPDYLREMTAYYDHGADQQESRGARYSYQDGILFNVDMGVLYPNGILQSFS